MSTPRQRLFDRLPEIYHIRDAEQQPRGQLEAYMDALDGVLAGVRDNIETLYHDLFIDTCDDWVIPYIADLLGSSHLAGDPWTLRADVARTVHHRRRKGTLGAIESLSHALSGWAAHAVELRGNVAWNQHLNHQRPDVGGRPPLASTPLMDPVRHGTITLRDPAWLSFFDGPFDPFAHLLDIRPPETGQARENFPTLGVFLWRLEDYRVPVSQPGVLIHVLPADSGLPVHLVQVKLHPLAEPMTLFNTHRYRADAEPPELSTADEVPGPMPAPRLSDDARTGNPDAYLSVAPYSGTVPDAPGSAAVGLTLHVPESALAGIDWTRRGANLCAWQDGLSPAIGEHEVVVDPEHGRVLMGVPSKIEAQALVEGLRASVTQGFSGPTGAQPVSRGTIPDQWQALTPEVNKIRFHDEPDGLALQKALAGLPTKPGPYIVEIQDSRTYELDITAIADSDTTDGPAALALADSLWIRAADGQRPVIRLQKPLRFRPAEITGSAAQDLLERLEVRLEGVYVSWDRGVDEAGDPVFPDDSALIERAALNRLSIGETTLDPGGSLVLDGSEHGSRGDMRRALALGADYGFIPGAERDAFDQVPEIDLKRSIAGTLALDDNYVLSLTDSIVDAGAGVADLAPGLAVQAATGDPEAEWGPPTTISGVTLFGRTRVLRITGRGGLFVHRLQAHDNQAGCLKFSYFRGNGDRLPPHHGCVFGGDAALSFVSHVFGRPGYGQLRLRSDRRILEQGPNRDAMGAFGYLLNAHKWKNLSIRFREYMPVGVRPMLIPVT
ncbi:hypothetical protein [Halomonas cerina]|uniref:Phage tail protein (Tail_P2_I) n=1 Tax=Halomonas cerina TaxID=447424 RepID=A0A839VGW8_9GAMM|nr:hypothetical protein [Halomonas cerina]MBB3191864.1 hypothetical protein [Halomonas cerina]